MPLSRNRNRKTRSRITVDHKQVDRFIHAELAPRLAAGMDDVVEMAQDIVAIDTGRMQSSVRHPEPIVESKRILCPLIVGGVKVRGVFAEQTFEREVNYSLSVEIRYGTLRSHLPEFGEAIAARMRRKRAIG